MPPISRREAIALSGLTVAGFSQSRPPSKSFGQAKACILLFPYGSPPQHEMFDPKPDAPAEIQGEMKSIATCMPGVRIGEGIPALAPIMDKLAVIRSVNHPYPSMGLRTLFQEFRLTHQHLKTNRAIPATGHLLVLLWITSGNFVPVVLFPRCRVILHCLGFLIPKQT